MSISTVSFSLSQTDFLLLVDTAQSRPVKAAPACTVNSYLFLRWLREQHGAEQTVVDLFRKEQIAATAKKRMERQVLCRLFEQGSKLWMAAIKQKTVFRDLETFFGSTSTAEGGPVPARFLSDTSEYYAMVYSVLTQRFDHPEYLSMQDTSPHRFVGPKGRADFTSAHREPSHILLDVQDMFRFLGPNVCPPPEFPIVAQSVTATEQSERVGSVLSLQKVLSLHSELAQRVLTTEEQRNTMFSRGDVWSEMLRLYARCTVTMLQQMHHPDFQRKAYENEPSARKQLRKEVYVQVSNQQMLPEDYCMIRSGQWDRARHFVEMLLNAMYGDKYLLPCRVHSILFMLQELDADRTPGRTLTELKPLRILYEALARYGPSPTTMDQCRLPAGKDQLMDRQLCWKTFVTEELWPSLVRCFQEQEHERDQFHALCQTLFNVHNMAAHSCFSDEARSVHTEHMKLARAIVLDWWFLQAYLVDTLLRQTQQLRDRGRSCTLQAAGGGGGGAGQQRMSLVHTLQQLREKETLQNSSLLTESYQDSLRTLPPLCYGQNQQLYVQWGRGEEGTLCQDTAPFYWSTVLHPLTDQCSDSAGLLITYDGRSVALCTMPEHVDRYLLFDPHMESANTGCTLCQVDAHSEDSLQNLLYLIRSSVGQYTVTRIQ